jgi:hypothetical protein
MSPRSLVLGIVVTFGLVLGAAPAFAHGFSSVVYAQVNSPEKEHLRTELGLEYDLLVVSAADDQQDDALFQAGTAAFDDGDPGAEAAALDGHAKAVLAYVVPRFTVEKSGETCTSTQTGDLTIAQRDGVPYAFITLDHTCASSEHGDYRVTSRLFPDSEGYVRGTKTILTYDVDGRSGSAALDADTSSVSLSQTGMARFWEFFRLGAEHLLGGPDHILFLLALIVGSRRLREVVLAATSVTLAHSVTFVLAALGLVQISPSVVEPVIALSIAVIAAWYLWRLWRRGTQVGDIDAGEGHFSLDRAGWSRLGVVFCFGLVHGLGFAGALGIDEAFSWTLLWSLLVFNVGIETVQLGLIILIFPVLVLVRHRVPRAGLWISGVVSAIVAVVGLFWFFERILGL